MAIKLCSVAMSESVGATLTFTARKTPGPLGVTADTTMVVQFTAADNGGTLAYGTDTTHTFAVAVGDQVSIKFEDVNLNNGGGRMVGVLELTPTAV